jgi:starch synthase
MKVALCASEAVPFAKTGGLADVCGALPLELEALGQEVILVMPKYPPVRAHGFLLKALDRDFDTTKIGDRVRVYFLKHEMYLRQGLYGDRFGDYPDNLRRFAYFCTKTLELFKKIDFTPDIVHCHDWQTALLPIYLKMGAQKKSPKSLLTIHNISYQGLFPKDQMPQTGLGWEYFSVSGLEYYDKINLLKGGIEYADLINTVSVTHSKEVQTEEFGYGLAGVLANRKESFFGIINGLDYKVWNPQSDPLVFRKYAAGDKNGKNVNKVHLQETCGLAQKEKVPLLGFVGRLVEAKGIDLIVKILPQLCQQGISSVFLGVGEARYEKALAEMAKKFSGLVFFSSRFDEELAHQIYAGADIFLMPSKFEPCGIGQMISFRYGTVPVVYKTGGLADTVIDYEFNTKKGSGFVFTKYNEAELFLALKRASELYAEEKKWHELFERIMRLNFSWKESARKYVGLYEKVRHL